MNPPEMQIDVTDPAPAQHVQQESTAKNVAVGLLYSFVGMLIGACCLPLPLALVLNAIHGNGINLFGFLVLMIGSGWIGFASGFAIFAVRITKKPWW